MRRRLRVAAATLGAMVAATGCGASSRSMPDCDGDTRLAIMAQSVPAAAYVPCVTELPAGWSFADLEVNHRGATIGLDSDRADRRVNVDLVASCDTDDATPIAPSDAGTRSYQSIDSIDPRYAGRFIDVFPGGCVVTHYDFERGAHVALITEIQQIVGLYSRRQLRQDVEAQLDIRLDP